MSFLAAAIPAVGSIVGGLLSGSASKKAAKAQMGAAQLGIDEQRRQFDLTRSDLEPWRLAGGSALQGQLALLGLGGDQAAAIEALRNSPQFASLDRIGTEALLQNASATGGLRGGNLQGSLYNQRTDLLAQLIDQQFSRLGGISGTGQQTATALGQFGQNSAAAIAQLLGQQGAARAGGILGNASGINQAIGGVTQLLGGLFGKGGLSIAGSPF